MNHKIIIAEELFQIAEQIEDKLKEADYRTSICSTIGELTAALENHSVDLLIASADFLNSNPQQLHLLKQQPSIVYAPDLDINEHPKYYKAGARRVISAFSELPEQVAVTAKMLLYSRHHLREIRRTNLTHGDMKALSLTELLQNAMLEEKNLVVKIHHANWDARIRITNGHVTDAQTSNLTGENALLKALQYAEGSFIIRGFKEANIEPEMGASTLALLAEKHYEQQVFHDFLNAVGQSSSNPVVRVEHNSSVLSLSRAQLKLLDLVEIHGNLKDVLRYSQQPFLATLRMLQEYAQKRIITFGEITEPAIQRTVDSPVTSAKEKTPVKTEIPKKVEKVTPAKPKPAIKAPDKEPVAPPEPQAKQQQKAPAEKVQENGVHEKASVPPKKSVIDVSQTELPPGTLLVLANEGRSKFINTIANLYNAPVKSSSEIDVTQIKLSDTTRFAGLGVSVQEAFIPTLEKVANQLIGGILLLDAQKPSEWEYGNYIFSQIANLYKRPYIVALTNLKPDSIKAIEALQKTLVLPAGATFRTLQTHSQEDVQAVLNYFAERAGMDPDDLIDDDFTTEESRNV